MNGFCPVCGDEAEKVAFRSKVESVSGMPLKGLVVTSHGFVAVGVTRCLGCGCRVSWYPDGRVVIWKGGGKMVTVPEGMLVVSPGEEL